MSNTSILEKFEATFFLLLGSTWYTVVVYLLHKFATLKILNYK
jgi:hypothetical protein